MSDKKSDQKKYYDLFIEEVTEALQDLNQILLGLEDSKDDPESLNEAFRLVHTIKGTAKILGFGEIGELAHTIEDVLDNIRCKNIPMGQDMIDLLFEVASPPS